MREKNILAETNPELIEEWHPIKNGELTPYDVDKGSVKKVWWLLPYDDPMTGKHFDFEWQASIKHRANGAGCPVLAGKIVWPGFNDLATTNPELVKEWHPTKNGELTPYNVLRGNEKKVWWQLSYDDPKTGKHFEFEWQASIYSRSTGVGCPYLSGRAVWPGFNDLATTNPELVKEWHPIKNGTITPHNVSSGSSKKVWWLLPYDDPETGKHFDFEWQDRIAHRSNGGGCPYITGQSVWPGFNDLATTNPEVAKEWHPTKNGKLKTKEVTAGSNRKVWWLLPYDDPKTGKHFDFEWEAPIASRVKGTGCPYLSNKSIWIGYNDLQSTHPELAKEWHPTKNGALKPTQFTYGDAEKVWWLLPYDDPKTGKHFDFEWKSQIASRTNGMGCPYLSGQAVYEGFNDLQSVAPDLAKEWHPTKNGQLKPTEVSLFSTKKVWWLLPYDDPETGKHFDFEWSSTVANRANGTDCPYLSGKAVWPGYNDLRSRYPEVAKEWDYNKNTDVGPDKITYGSTKEVWWICPKNHSYKAMVTERTRGRGCPICDKERTTSFPEYIIYYYIKQLDDTVIHSYKELGFEIDVFLPHKKIGIEYDGAFWHKNKQTADIEKNRKCDANGITLYRFRENELGSLDDTSIDICVPEKNFPKELEKLLLKIFGNNVDFSIDIDRDYQKINDLRVFSEKDNSLLINNPRLAAEWHPTKNGRMTPDTVSANSSKRVWWYMPYDDPETGKHFDFEWMAGIADRTSGNGCPFLSNKAVWPGFNDLETLCPDVAIYWHPTKNKTPRADSVTPGSEKRVWWYMPYDDPETGKHFDFEWETTVACQVKSNNCPYITGHSVWPGYNDLQTVNPQLAKEWHPTKNGALKPTDVTASSGKKVWWLLPYDDPETGKHFDFEWQSKIASRNYGVGCPYLLQQAVWPGYNDLATLYPDIAKEWDYKNNIGITPDMFTRGSKKIVWWKCQNGHTWQASIGNRTTKGSGCPKCRWNKE